jgi:hypothetical protein
LAARRFGGLVRKPSQLSCSASANKPRLVWILFDELAYKPVFEARDPSLQLPNFDRLRSESTLYTDMTPIAYRTTRAVPSLLLGRAVTDVDLHRAEPIPGSDWDDSHWKTFDANARCSAWPNNMA